MARQKQLERDEAAIEKLQKNSKKDKAQEQTIPRHACSVPGRGKRAVAMLTSHVAMRRTLHPPQRDNAMLWEEEGEEEEEEETTTIRPTMK
eukprot:401283-Amphidinium_carterae.1